MCMWKSSPVKSSPVTTHAHQYNYLSTYLGYVPQNVVCDPSVSGGHVSYEREAQRQQVVQLVSLEGQRRVLPEHIPL
jgi:hypothetical protein